MNARRAVVLLALGVMLPHPVRATTKLEGDYQLMMDLRKNDRTFLWDWDSNNNDTFNNAQFRLLSQPAAGMDAFVRFEGAWRSNDNAGPRPEFQYRDAHLHFRREKAGHGYESYVFSRQDRFYSNTFLIPWVSGRGDAQGVRLDTWGYGRLAATFIAADFSNEFNPANFPAAPHQPRDSVAAQRERRTSDAYVLRLRREFLPDNALRTGITVNRFEGWTGIDSTNGPSPWSSVVGVDTRWRVRNTDISFEYGESRDTKVRPDTVHTPKFTTFGRPLDARLPDRSVAQAEIRSLRIGTPHTGYIAVTPGWWSRGPLWQNQLGGPNSDETGFYINSYYLLPDRAVTYSSNLLWYGNRIYSRTQTRELYNELYVEFVNGFTGKTAYKRRDIYRTPYNVTTKETSLEWFNEMQVESRLAWLRLQIKSANIGRADNKQLFAMETKLKLSPRTVVYNRFVFGNDPSIVRKGIFAQLQYRPTGNMEMFLQYGPDYIGGGSKPVDDGNLNGGADQKDIVKFILKGNF